MKVIIKEVAKSAMQSGKNLNKKNRRWILTDYIAENVRHLDSLMGWTSCDDTKTQIKLFFHTKEEAIKYANDEGFEYEVITAKTVTIKPKSYAANFTN